MGTEGSCAKQSCTDTNLATKTHHFRRCRCHGRVETCTGSSPTKRGCCVCGYRVVQGRSGCLCHSRHRTRCDASSSRRCFGSQRRQLGKRTYPR